jgi:hypothetical protein
MLPSKATVRVIAIFAQWSLVIGEEDAFFDGLVAKNP